MTYTALQINIIRAALIDVRVRAGEINNRSWKNILTEIGIYTDYIVPEDRSTLKTEAEKLRQFAEGYSKGKDPGKFHMPSDEFLSYIVSFLTHEENLYISLDELFNPDVGIIAARHLLHFLNDSYLETEGKKLYEDNITYVLHRNFGESGRTTALFFKLSDYSGIFSTSQIDLEWTRKGRKNAFECIRTISSYGWAVTDQKNNIKIFLKRMPDRENYGLQIITESNDGNGSVFSPHLYMQSTEAIYKLSRRDKIQLNRLSQEKYPKEINSIKRKISNNIDVGIILFFRKSISDVNELINYVKADTITDIDSNELNLVDFNTSFEMISSVFDKQHGDDLINSIKEGDYELFRNMIDQQQGVTSVEPETGMMFLHYIAAFGDRRMLRYAMKHMECDFFHRDSLGRLPSELAITGGNDPAMAKLLMIKENQDASKQGTKPLMRTDSPSHSPEAN